MASDLTFFSVDVESSRLNPFALDSYLLSIAAVAMDEDGLYKNSIYIRLNNNQWLAPEWWDPTLETDNSTLEFWREQDEHVRNEAWLDKDLPRFSNTIGAQMLSDFVTSFGESWEDRIFVANPATFDFAWTLRLWADAHVPDPFHYRTLCLRSQAFGANGSKNWHTFPHRTNKPETPHHPLSDALAQMKDFADMVKAGK